MFLVGLPTILLLEVLLLAPVCAVTKWTLMGRYREGNYPLWGWVYLRWWMVRCLAHRTALQKAFFL